MADMSPRRGGGSNRQAVYASLRRRILRLDLPPGAALSEKDLAGALGVSRTPVRESLILLSEEGLVQVFPKLGTFVARIDAARVLDAQFLGEAVELGALEDVPADPAADVVTRLRENLARQRVVALDREEFLRLDDDFHHHLLRLSGHGRAWASLTSARGHLDRARRLGRPEPGPLLAQHQDVLDAVLTGDTEAARSTLRHHLRSVLDDLERVRRRSPELFTPDSSTVPVRGARRLTRPCS